MTSRPVRIGCVGEAMIELTFDSDAATIGFAGDTLNTAIYLVREGAGRLAVSFITRIGTDPLSDRMIDFIARQGVGTDTITRHPERVPGLYAIHTDETGERSFTYWRDKSAARTLFEDGFDALSGHEVIYFSAITLAILPPQMRIALMAWLEAFGGLVAFDSNFRPALWESEHAAREWIGRAWTRCDIALPSLDDEKQIFGDRDETAVLARLRALGIRRGALKRGRAGPLPIDPDVVAVPAFEPASKVVDTTAAGDGFNAGYLASHLLGNSEQEALLAGHQLASRIIGHPGAIMPME